jgi:flagellar motor switch protein FliM
MINGVDNNLTKERIQQLIAAVGSRTAEDEGNTDVEEYNWFEPHYFNNEHLVKLTELTEKMAINICEKFVDLCRNEFDISIISTTQHYANELSEKTLTDEEKEYYVIFGTDKEHLFGLFGIPEKTALTWAKQLLGDSEVSEDSGKEISKLEESLLLDLASALIKIFSKLFLGNEDIGIERNLVKQKWPLEIESTEELCKICFNVKKHDEEKDSTAYFIIPCNKLDSVLGVKTLNTDNTTTSDIHRNILDHLGLTQVKVTAQLACSHLSFEDVMNLQVDDIVVLEKRVDEPMELMVGDRTVCYGWPGKCSGEYILKIVNTAFENTSQKKN